MRYYLYRHIRPDRNEVFYVGIGTKSNKLGNFVSHIQEYGRAYKRSGRTLYWSNIVNLNPSYEIEILLESDDFNSINNKEIEFIKLYGRIDLETGTLVNLNDGGNSNFGYKHREETRLKMSKSRLNPNYGNITKSRKKGNSKDKAKPVIRISPSRREEYKNIKEACLIYGFSQASITSYIRKKTADKGNGYWKYKPTKNG